METALKRQTPSFPSFRSASGRMAAAGDGRLFPFSAHARATFAVDSIHVELYIAGH